MTRRAVVFTEPKRIDITNEEIPYPGDGEVLVKTHVSAISAGTELHVYRGDIPDGAPLDESLPSLQHEFHYPTMYGYASVGEVVEDGRRVFAFQPHVSHYVAADGDFFELPDSVSFEHATLWPTVETAVNLVLDGAPLVGERVLVVGQGVVGLVTTSLLSQFPLETLVTVDPIEGRRIVSQRLGASRSLPPDASSALEDFDLAFELSGTPSGLDIATGATGFEGRIVLGSWYGEAPRPLSLGMRFHRARLKLVGSQVSHIGSPLLSRWTKKRRMRVAAAALEKVPEDVLVSHRIPVERAAEAYALLDEHPERCLQVLLTYT